MISSTEADLIRAHYAGDEQALPTLIERFLPFVFRFLVRMVGNQQLAEDLSQETFIKVWQNLSRFHLNQSFKTWTLSIARNVAIDYLRKKQAIPFSNLENEDLPDFGETIADPQALPSDLLLKNDLAQELSQALATLPPKTRSIILLHDTEGLTFQEIADGLQESINTVKSRYRRGVQALHTYFVEKKQEI